MSYDEDERDDYEPCFEDRADALYERTKEPGSWENWEWEYRQRHRDDQDKEEE